VPVTPRSRRLVGPLLVPLLPTVVATVPAGKTWRVRGGTLANASSGVAVAFVLELDPAGGPTPRIVYQDVVPLGNRPPFFLELAMHAGDSVRIRASVDAVLELQLSGAELTGSP
jgi:hypothetical protein